MSTTPHPQQNQPQPTQPRFEAPTNQPAQAWPAAAPAAFQQASPAPVYQATPPGFQAITPPTSGTTRPVRRWAEVGVAAILAAAMAVGGTTWAIDQRGDTTAAATSVVTQRVAAEPGTQIGEPDWTAVASAVSPSVVSITVTTQQGSGAGSGVVWDSAGHIVTNNHVVSGARSVEVTMADQVTYTAEVVATDAVTDLAVLQLVDPPDDLTPITQQRTEPAVGDPVMAIGNPLGLSGTVTTGIISAVDRPVVSSGETSTTASVTLALQTSAAINPGNSGGALVDASGHLVGINSSIATLSQSTSSQSGNIGIGFAIPTAQVSSVVTQLINDGRATHAALGVAVTDGSANLGDTSLAGAEVAQLQSDGPSAGQLQTGDVITQVNDQRVISAAALIGVIRSLQVGDAVALTVYRSGSSKATTVTVTLGDANG